MSAAQPYDAAVEALRHALNDLPRFSFWTDGKGGVARVPDKYGAWIEWDAAHALFDPDVVDLWLAKVAARTAIKKAGEQA